MAESVIPVDLRNPGQVFACLGLLELADSLIGDTEAGFDFGTDSRGATYRIRSQGPNNPVDIVLGFLATSEPRAVAPPRWRPKKIPETTKALEKLEEEIAKQRESSTYPCSAPDTSAAMPIELIGKCGHRFMLSHYADGSKRNPFKLYAGNRSALSIATRMLQSVADIWNSQRNELTKNPLDLLTPMGGSFNFDPRGAWTAVDVGYSPDAHNHMVTASPVVEMLAACGLEHTRPVEYETRKIRYAAWSASLPPILARVALAAGAIPGISTRSFRSELAMSGKNKIVTFAVEEVTNDQDTH